MVPPQPLWAQQWPQVWLDAVTGAIRELVHESGVDKGRVAGLWRYPVKSMAGERLEQTELGWHGLPGDRRYA